MRKITQLRCNITAFKGLLVKLFVICNRWGIETIIMVPQVTISGQPVIFSAAYPGEAAEYKLFNSQCFYTGGSFGSLLAQYLTSFGFAVLYTVASIKEDTSVTITLHEPVFFCYINLSQPFEVALAKGDTVGCKRNSVSLAFSSLWEYTIHLKRGDYCSLTVIYPVSFVKKQLLFFPLLENIREKLKKEQQWVLPNLVVPVFVAITNCIYEILHVPRMFFTEQHHQANMKQLLKEVFRHMSENTLQQPLSTLSDVDAVRKAKDWIDMNLDKHITAAGLAKKVSSNEFKLKRGFKAAYHIGIYGYLLQQRLLIARGQLENTTLPIREIARRAGYRKSVNFSAAFKRVYGITPGRHRHHYKQTN